MTPPAPAPTWCAGAQPRAQTRQDNPTRPSRTTRPVALSPPPTTGSTLGRRPILLALVRAAVIYLAPPLRCEVREILLGSLLRRACVAGLTMRRYRIQAVFQPDPFSNLT